MPAVETVKRSVAEDAGTGQVEGVAFVRVDQFGFDVMRHIRVVEDGADLFNSLCCSRRARNSYSATFRN
jgi:hypothetical protein